MVNIKDIMRDVSLQAGLKIKDTTVFGLYRGFQVALDAGPMGSRFVLLVSFPKKDDSYSIQSQIDSKKLLKMVKSMGQVKVEQGVVLLTFAPTWKPPKADQLVGLIGEITSVLSVTTEKYNSNCEKCETPGSTVVLVNGSPIQLCNACLENLRRQAGYIQEDQATLQPNYAKGIAFALGAALVSGFIWALIAYFLGYIFYIAGFLIGLFVAYAIAEGAGKVTVGVIGLGIVMTFFAVILGQVFVVAIALAVEGISLGYLFDALGYYLAEAPGDFLIALVTALIGVVYVAYNLYSRAKSEKVPIEIAT
jgi:hypothetical protein